MENYSNWSAWALVFAIDKNHFDVAKTIFNMEFIKIEQLQEAFISCKSTIIGNGFTDLLELFLKRGVVLNPIRFIRDWKTAQFFLDRDFPLTIDSFDYSQNLFDLLVEKLGHANLNIPADDLLLHAVFKRDKEAVKKLLLKGAKIEPGYITRSLWKYHFEFEIFKLLVDANAISPLNSE